MNSDLREIAIEAILENSEAVIDIVTDDELLAAIPVVGTAIKACKAIDSIRDRAFAAKLISFLKGTGPARTQTIEKWKIKLIESPDEARKIGQTLFFSIERINDLDKADIIALLFLDYIDGGTTSETYLRFLHAIDSAGVSDMHEFISRKDLPEDFKEEWARFLIPSGLTKLSAYVPWQSMGNLYFIESDLGKDFRSAYIRGLAIKNAG